MQMTTPLPFDLFSSELFPGETVQWTGRPNAAVIFHTEDWALIPFSLLWGRFAIFWLLGASGIGDFWTNRPDKTFQWFGVIWGTPFVLMGQWFQGPHSIKCLLREHDNHRQAGSPRWHW